MLALKSRDQLVRLWTSIDYYWNTPIWMPNKTRNHHLITMKWQSSLVHGWLTELNYTWVCATLWEFVTSFSGQSYNNSTPGLILHSIGLQTIIHQWAMVNPAHIQDTMRGRVCCDVVSKMLIGNPRMASAQWGKRHCSLEMCWYMPPNFHSPDN